MRHLRTLRNVAFLIMLSAGLSSQSVFASPPTGFGNCSCGVFWVYCQDAGINCSVLNYASCDSICSNCPGWNQGFLAECSTGTDLTCACTTYSN
jgi:hypothetical protein